MTDWRGYLRDVHGIVVHPEADQWPMLEEEALRRLGIDLIANGLRNPITVYTPGTTLEDRNAAVARGKKHLIDGRNRFASLPLVLSDQEFAEHVNAILDPSYRCSAALRRLYADSVRWVDDYETVGDVKAFIDSCNLHRRHLEPEDYRQRVEALLKANPLQSNRSIANRVGTSPTTVGVIRSKLEQSGAVSKMDTHVDSKGRRQPATKRSPSFRSRLEAARQATAMDVTHIQDDVSSIGHAEPAPERAQRETSAGDRSEIPAPATSSAPTSDPQSLKTCPALLPADQALVHQIWPPSTHEAALAPPPEPSSPPNLAERLARLLDGIRDVTAEIAAFDSFDADIVDLLQYLDGETSFLRLTLRRHLPSEDEDASVTARFLAAIRAAGPTGILKDKINDLAPKKWRAPQVSCILDRLCDEGKITRLDLKQRGAAERWIATERA